MYSSSLDHSEVDEVTIHIDTYYIHEKLTIHIASPSTRILNTLK